MTTPVGPPPLPEEGKGEKGDTGETGARGPRGVQGPAGDFDVLGALSKLSVQVGELDANVDRERKARLKEAESRDKQAFWFKVAIGVISLFVILSIVAAVESWQTSNATDKNADNDRKQAIKSDERIQASLVGVCAVVNVNRLQNQNMLAEINTEKPFELNSSWPAFLDKWRKEWSPVECRALVNDEIGVQLCLQYPPTIDPNTGKPVPTTIDPINEKACPDSEPPK